MSNPAYNKLLSTHLDNVLKEFEQSGSKGLTPSEVFKRARKKLKLASITEK